jgi:hypothetical protein
VIVQRSFGFGAAKLYNSIVAENSAANCLGVTSKGYNLSSDGSCAFNGAGDLNNTDPMIGFLRDNGGPTKTMALRSGSLAVDAGDPSGCKVKTDQRGEPRPDPEDAGGCDIGAYELFVVRTSETSLALGPSYTFDSSSPLSFRFQRPRL